ncbi:hypothetical protein H6P81_015041 [Aristolochia fimbriata]|uniref:Transmembrane protein n=1 Tax=Aristolochia fimbriata TaxID=158543 RepID=A0AAV7E795_ARIFI|nr:hypothetical protein H6P81_015041 [Aristolochia fimbriata]
MEDVSQGLRSVAQQESLRTDYMGGPSASAGKTHVVLRTSPGSAVTMVKCAKACAISFSIGVVVGFMLRKRFRRWIAKKLKRLKDD